MKDFWLPVLYGLAIAATVAFFFTVYKLVHNKYGSQRAMILRLLFVGFAAVGLFTAGIIVANARPREATLAHAQGTQHLEAGRFDEAIEQFTTAIELDEDYGNAYFGRAKAHLSKQNVQAAILDVEKALSCAETEDDRALFLNLRGTAKSVRGDIDGAIADYTASISRADHG